MAYLRCTISAPAQSANFLGMFDLMGFCCSLTPTHVDAERGGPGNLVSVERMPGAPGRVELQVFMRRCDQNCNWLPREPYRELHEELAAYPERDIARWVARRTLRHIGRLTGEPVRDGLRIEITIHSPNGKTGLGLGGSASSAAVAIAVDELYGAPIRRGKDGTAKLLRIMGQGERVASGRVFYDNVAPLIFAADAVFVAPPARPGAVPIVSGVDLPRGLHLVTITPDYAVSTKKATEALRGESVPVLVAESAASRYLQLFAALISGDLDGVIAHAGNRLVDPVRSRFVPDLATIRNLVDGLNSSLPRGRSAYACGLSGSGPTMYVATGSAANAALVAAEAPFLLRRNGINAWAFVHTPNTRGAQVLELA
jgi:homoserine kinase